MGGQDSLVFDGSSFAIDSSGKVVAQAKQFHEDKLEINFTSKKMVGAIAPNQHGELHQIYQALVLGIRDYILKNNIPGIILGLSGGIDSALALAICVDAIGADKIKCFSLPSEYTSDESKNLAKAQAKLQNVRLENLDINNIFHEILDITKISKNSLAAQNIQARIRGNLLMAIANENDYILVNTSNRSELATGYGTLYGDLAGGFAILKNIPKTLVFELAKWRNEKCKAIIDAIINRQPTAELAYKQKIQMIYHPMRYLTL